MNSFIYYLIVINFLSFVLFGLDKWFAKKKKNRIRNSTLIGLSVLGVSIGSLFGMYLFRHKTQTWYYVYGIPVIFIIQIIIFYNLRNI